MKNVNISLDDNRMLTVGRENCDYTDSLMLVCNALVSILLKEKYDLADVVKVLSSIREEYLHGMAYPQDCLLYTSPSPRVS